MSTEASDPSVTSRSAKPPTKATATHSTPAPTASASSAPTSPPPDPNSQPGRARLAQIPAAELPGFNQEWEWTDSRSLQDSPLLCLPSSLVSIGAVNQAGTKFTSTATRSAWAVQITGVFPDEQTAVTAAVVLTAWHDTCAAYAVKELGLKHVDGGESRAVPTPVGEGRQWMVTYRPVRGQPDSVWFNSAGFVRDGDTITYLVYRSAGQDYNYPVGSEPIDRGLVLAGSYLEQTRAP